MISVTIKCKMNLILHHTKVAKITNSVAELLIYLSHNWEISSVFIGLEAVDFKANPVSCILAVMISFRHELKKVIHLRRGGLLWYPLLSSFYCSLTQQNLVEHTNHLKNIPPIYTKDYIVTRYIFPPFSSSHWNLFSISVYNNHPQMRC